MSVVHKPPSVALCYGGLTDQDTHWILPGSVHTLLGFFKPHLSSTPSSVPFQMLKIIIY